MRLSPRFKIAVSLIFVVFFLSAASLGFSESLKLETKIPPWGNVGLIALALCALLWGGLIARELQEQDASSTDRTIILPDRLRWLTWIAAAILIAYVLYRIPQMMDVDRYLGVFLAWLIALIFFLYPLLPSARAFSFSRGFFKQRFVWMFLALITFALILRAYKVDSIPFTLAGDEASQGLESVAVLEGKITNPFTTGWLGVPTLSFFYNAITIYLFGQTILGLRLAWVLIGTATIAINFFLVRRVAGAKQIALAWAAAIMLAAYHFHIHFSRLGSNQIADPFFMSLALFFLVRAYDDRRLVDWALAGIVTGLAMYFYAGARLTPVVMIAALAYLFIRQPRTFFNDHKRGLLILLAGFLISAAPMIQYAIRFPNDFNARINQVGIIQSGWLMREIEIRGESAGTILWDQFQRAALPFHFYVDRTVWYGLETPWLDPLFGMIMLLGLGYVTVRLILPQSNPRLIFFAAWWWGGVILGGMLTESPPSSQRLITLSVPAIFFIVFALAKFADLVKRIIPIVTKRRVLGVSVIAFALISLNTYFYDFTPRRIYGGDKAEFATTIAPRLNELKYNHRFVFIGSPFMYWGFSTIPYLVPDAEAADYPEDPIAGLLPAEMIGADKGTVFVIASARQGEIEWLARSFPRGDLEAYYSAGIGGYLGSLYIVPPAVKP